MNSTNTNRTPLASIVTPEQYISAISANIAAFHELMRIREAVISRAEDEDLKALYEISDKIADHSDYSGEMAGEINDLTEEQEKKIAAAKAHQLLLDRVDELWAACLKARTEDDTANAAIDERNAEKDADRAYLSSVIAGGPTTLANLAKEGKFEEIAEKAKELKDAQEQLAAIEPNEEHVDTVSALYEKMREFCAANGLKMPEETAEKKERKLYFTTDGKELVVLHCSVADFKNQRRYIDGYCFYMSDNAMRNNFTADKVLPFAIGFGKGTDDFCLTKVCSDYTPAKEIYAKEILANLIDCKSRKEKRERDDAAKKAEAKRQAAEKRAENERLAKARAAELTDEIVVEVRNRKATNPITESKFDLPESVILNGKKIMTGRMSGKFRAKIEEIDGKKVAKILGQI